MLSHPPPSLWPERKNQVNGGDRIAGNHRVTILFPPDWLSAIGK